MSRPESRTLNLRPLHDWVLVQLLDLDLNSQGGIALPAGYVKHLGRKAKVLAVGPGKTLEDGSKQEIALKTGETVILAGAAGSEVDRKDQLLVRYTDCLLVVEDVA